LMNTTRGDLFEALSAAARGELDPSSLEPSGEHALCVVLGAEGYPESPRKGDVIRGVDEASALEGVRVYHAGTARSNGDLVTAGGRVLAVTARGASLVEAHRRAYAAARRIEFRGMQYRRDIGARALG
jgi:phosphoribosylamine--glycine ligase